MIRRCIFCDRPVLEIAGDQRLDTVCFGSGRTGSLLKIQAEIAESKIYGDCHSRCLASSLWFEKWVEVFRSFLFERGFRLVIPGDPDFFSDPKGSCVSLHFHERRRMYSFFHGGVVGITQNGMHLICRDSSVYWDLSGYCQVNRTVPVPEPGKGVSLRAITDAWDISEYYDDLQLDEGIFESVKESKDSYQRDRVLVGTLRYPIDLPDGLAGQVYQYLQSGGARIRQQVSEDEFGGNSWFASGL